MKGLLKYMSPLAPDQSGAVSVFYALGGITVICDAGGCTGNICGFDEPRWFMGKSAIFSAGLRDMDAILGRDDRLVDKLKDAASHLESNFAAIIGTPVPAVIATDFRALKRMAEKRVGIPVMTVECTGTRLYDQGAEEAYLELFKTFAKQPAEGESLSVEPNSVGVIGTIPLDMSHVRADMVIARALQMEGTEVTYCYGMGSGIEEVKKAGKVEKNVVVSPAGIKAAQYLEKTFGTPYEVRYPMLLEQECENLKQYAGKKVLIIHQQVAANAMRDAIRVAGTDGEIVCGTWFMQKKELAEPQDVHFEREEKYIEYVEAQNFDVILGDKMFRRPLKNFKGEYVEVPHFAVSGQFEENF